VKLRMRRRRTPPLLSAFDLATVSCVSIGSVRAPVSARKEVNDVAHSFIRYNETAAPVIPVYRL